MRTEPVPPITVVIVPVKQRDASMRDAVAETCNDGHQYYAESGALTRCPYCLVNESQILRNKLGRIRNLHAYMTDIIEGG